MPDLTIGAPVRRLLRQPELRHQAHATVTGQHAIKQRVTHEG